MAVATWLVLTANAVAMATDGFEDEAPYLTDPFAHWPAVGCTLLFVLLIAAAGFKDAKRTRLE